MKLGIIGTGRIGGNVARQAVKGGHDVKLSFSRDPARLEQLASELGERDATNQFGPGPKPAPGQTAASFNAERMPGARHVKSFNTLTSAFQAEAADRAGNERIVQWLCGADPEAKRIVRDLIGDMGYVAVDLGGTATCEVMEHHGAPARSMERSTGRPKPKPSSMPSAMGTRSRLRPCTDVGS